MSLCVVVCSGVLCGRAEDRCGEYLGWAGMLERVRSGERDKGEGDEDDDVDRGGGGIFYCPAEGRA